MSDLVAHAEYELARAGFFSGSEYHVMIGEAVMELVRVFAQQGHSGASAAFALAVFQRLAAFMPLTPLQGTDDEWTPIGDGHYQNKRCARVFKDPSGNAYDVGAVVFRDPDGSTYLTPASRIQISFPYAPRTEIIDVPAENDQQEGQPS